MSFYVSDPWATELHEMKNIMLLDAEISEFALFYCVLILSILSTASCERKNAPFGFDVMARLLVQTVCFVVCL